MTPQVYAKARAEVIALFGWAADCLTPDQTLRLDCAVALRLALDDLQGRVIRGEAIDMNRMLTASEALSRLLPSAVLAAPPPEAERTDPREKLWQMYMTMRQRGGVSVYGSEFDAVRATAIELAEEVEAAKDAQAGSLVPLPPNVPASKNAPVAAPEPQPQPKVDLRAGFSTSSDPEPWRDFISSRDPWRNNNI
jgi:hypothetical protein